VEEVDPEAVDRRRTTLPVRQEARSGAVGCPRTGQPGQPGRRCV